MQNYHFMSAVILSIANISSAIAQSPDLTASEKLVIDNNIYEYESIKESGNEKRYNTIKATTTTGTNLLTQNIDVPPGCDFDIPSIQKIILPNKNKNPNNYLIAYCGSHSGKSNKMVLYKPNFGIINTIDFLNSKPIIKQNEFNLELIIFKEIFLKEIESKITIPTIYELNDNENLITTAETSDKSKYKNLLNDDYFLSNTQKAKIERIIILALSGETEEACTQAKEIGVTNYLRDNSEKISINLNYCE
ncbi:hypothetical protein KOE80_04720 [Alcaligenes sp. 13f]|uniref:hypothetical protein n=1 Tax=Alcaligenes sp. 13f TaxID=2841924 RepID=UPI001CF6F8C1|nr:hypothetical protein [Alcaligenes sp. 13f]MCB4321506.1 hypothetical protein [Alcaligenes sp. 13f]